MKSLRWIVIGSLSLALAGCGVFFAPLQGRWNPADPDRDEGTVITASVSGYVTSPSGNDFSSIYMNVGDTAMGLLRFPTANMPRVVVSAVLELYLPAASTMNISASPILQDWDPAYITWATASSAGFAGPAGPSVAVSAYGWYPLDVTAALKNADPEAFKGLLIKGAYAGYTASFSSNRVSGQEPRLRVYGY